MDRIAASILTIVWSVFLYLCIRLANKHEMSVSMQNFLMFWPASILFLIWWLMIWDVFWLGREMLFIMVVWFSLFSGYANHLSLLSMKHAVNPWYSLMISKSYVILSSLLAVFLFWSPLTATDIWAIVMIVFFACFLFLEPGSSLDLKDKKWFFYALGAFVWWAFLALLNRRILLQWMGTVSLLFRLFFLVSLSVGFQFFHSDDFSDFSAFFSWEALWIVCWMIVFNYGLIHGYAVSPNPGYLNAANAASIAFLTLASSLIFKDELTMRKMIGIVGVVVWISLLFVF